MKVALVLSGGGIWATGGIGVLRALEDLGHTPDFVVGTSSGAIIASLWAIGVPVSEMSSLALSLSRRDVPISWRNIGGQILGHRRLPEAILDGAPLWNKLGRWLHSRTIREVVHPLYVVATSLTERQTVVFGSEPIKHGTEFIVGGSEIDLLTAVRASSAVPGFFSPILWQQHVLVDGGVGDDYPLDVAEMAGADRALGLWIDEPARWRIPSPRPHAFDVLVESMAVMIREITILRQRALSISHVDLRLELSGHTVFERIPAIIEMAYEAAMKQRDHIDQLFSATSYSPQSHEVGDEDGVVL